MFLISTGITRLVLALFWIGPHDVPLYPSIVSLAILDSSSINGTKDLNCGINILTLV